MYQSTDSRQSRLRYHTPSRVLWHTLMQHNYLPLLMLWVAYTFTPFIFTSSRLPSPRRHTRSRLIMRVTTSVCCAKRGLLSVSPGFTVFMTRRFPPKSSNNNNNNQVSRVTAHTVYPEMPHPWFSFYCPVVKLTEHGRWLTLWQFTQSERVRGLESNGLDMAGFLFFSCWVQHSVDKGYITSQLIVANVQKCARYS